MSTKLKTRPKNTVTFEQAAEQLRSGADLKSAWLRGFNDLSEEQIASFPNPMGRFVLPTTG